MRAEAGRSTAVARAGQVVRAHDVGGPGVQCPVFTDSLTGRLGRRDVGLASGRSGETGLPKTVCRRNDGALRPLLRG